MICVVQLIYIRLRHLPGGLERKATKKKKKKKSSTRYSPSSILSMSGVKHKHGLSYFLSLSPSFAFFLLLLLRHRKKKQRWLPYEKERGWVLRKSGGMKRKEMNDEVVFFCTMTSFDKIKGKRKEKRMEFSLVNKIQMSCLEKKNQSI